MNKELRKKIDKTFFIVRDLKESEKGKSLDYWEGYTKAVTKLYKIIKKNDFCKIHSVL